MRYLEERPLGCSTSTLSTQVCWFCNLSSEVCHCPFSTILVPDIFATSRAHLVYV